MPQITVTEHLLLHQKESPMASGRFTRLLNDLILAANLIEQLRDPKRFLLDVAHRLNAGGILVLSSTYHWQEALTPKEHWLGGIRENGEALASYPALQRLLAPAFDELAEPQDLPLVIRQTARHYQHALAQVTFWRKRAG